MKRLLVFGLFGSVLWAFSACFVIDLLFGDFTFPSAERLALMVTDIPGSLPLGLIFAIVVGTVDFASERASLPGQYRVAACAMAGFITVCLLCMPRDPAMSTFASISLAAAIPGAICSWISGSRTRDVMPPPLPV